jgi:cell division protein FtsL
MGPAGGCETPGEFITLSVNAATKQSSWFCFFCRAAFARQRKKFRRSRMRARNRLKAEIPSRSFRKKNLFIIAAVLVFLYFIFSVVFGEMGLIKYFRMKRQYDSLASQTEQLKHDNAKLAKEVRALRSDPEYIERIARDKLGLARPGEIVYYYDAFDGK